LKQQSAVKREVVLGSLEWQRGPAQFEDGWIRIRQTEPIHLTTGETDAPVEFAGIRSPDDAVAFAGQYGMLSRTQEATFSDWQREVAVISSVMDVWVAMSEARAGETQELRRVLPSLLTSASEGAVTLQDALSDDDVLEAGQLALDTIASGHIAKIGFTVWRGRFVLWPKTLQQLMYLELAMLLTSGRTVRRCALCGRVFRPKNRVMRYCSEAHANRARYERMVERQRESVDAVDAGPAAP
jgi:uncharacterized C2H2 Zn-finger protein